MSVHGSEVGLPWSKTLMRFAACSGGSCNGSGHNASGSTAEFMPPGASCTTDSSGDCSVEVTLSNGGTGATTLTLQAEQAGAINIWSNSVTVTVN
jgi:hypothetical protein